MYLEAELGQIFLYILFFVVEDEGAKVVAQDTHGRLLLKYE